MMPQELRVYTSTSRGYAFATVSTIGGNIARLRKAAGYATQGAFARALDVPQPRLSDWENDRYGVPEIPNLLRMAKVLRISLNQLIEGVDPAYDEILSDPLRHADTVELAPHSQGGARRVGDSEAHIAALTARLAEYEALIPTLQSVTHSLVRLSIKRAEDAAARDASSGRSRRRGTHHR